MNAAHRVARTKWLAPSSLALVLAASGVACSGEPAAPSIADDATPLENGSYDVERYELSGELDWDRRRLMATTKVTLRPGGLTTIALDSAVDVKAVRFGDGKPASFTVDAAHRKLLVELPGKTRHAAALRLEIDYEARGVISDTTLQNGLFTMPALKGDPAASRVAFTYSEPLPKVASAKRSFQTIV